MNNPFKRQDPYAEYKAWCCTKRVRQVGKQHTTNEVFTALKKLQNENIRDFNPNERP